MNEIQTSLGATAGSHSAAVQSVTVQSAADAHQNSQHAAPTGFFFSSDSVTLRSHRTQAEIHAIRQALARTGWIRKRAARILAISYRSLLYKIDRYKITPPIPVREEGPEMIAQQQNPGQTWQVR
jgi:transcriptional regulator with GAF, ATPase, and Fis domain